MTQGYCGNMSNSTGTVNEPVTMESIAKVMALMPRPAVVCSPFTFSKLKLEFDYEPLDDKPISFRMPIFSNPYMDSFGPMPTGKWLWHEGGYFPPQDKFVEYEASDLPWLEKLGMVKREMKQTHRAFLINSYV